MPGARKTPQGGVWSIVLAAVPPITCYVHQHQYFSTTEVTVLCSTAQCKNDSSFVSTQKGANPDSQFASRKPFT